MALRSLIIPNLQTFTILHMLPMSKKTYLALKAGINALETETFFYLRLTEQDTLFDEILHGEQITVTAPIWVIVNER
jgi:hypothetical protein